MAFGLRWDAVGDLDQGRMAASEAHFHSLLAFIVWNCWIECWGSAGAPTGEPRSVDLQLLHSWRVVLSRRHGADHRSGYSCASVGQAKSSVFCISDSPVLSTRPQSISVGTSASILGLAEGWSRFTLSFGPAAKKLAWFRCQSHQETHLISSARTGRHLLSPSKSQKTYDDELAFQRQEQPYQCVSWIRCSIWPCHPISVPWWFPPLTLCSTFNYQEAVLDLDQDLLRLALVLLAPVRPLIAIAISFTWSVTGFLDQEFKAFSLIHSTFSQLFVLALSDLLGIGYLLMLWWMIF